MIKQFIIVFSLIFLVFAQSALPGTWRDDFEDGNLDGWAKRDIIGVGEFEIQNGGLSALNEGGTSAIWLEGSDWQDFTAEASVCLLEEFPANDREMSIVLRADMANLNGYWFCLQFAGGNYAFDELQIWKITGFPNFAKQVAKRYELSEDKWYRMKCSIAGDHLSFYLDNELHCEADVAGFTSGTLTLCVCDVHVLIDDIVVTGDDVPDGGSPVQIEGDVKSGGKLATTWGGMKFYTFNGH
jgi:hypothetical protein